jgi:O-acetyl-ADP-ribose deacetylase (regulator of RNase III)
MKIEVVVGNIVMQPDLDAVVNSANANLRLGSGVNRKQLVRTMLVLCEFQAIN